MENNKSKNKSNRIYQLIILLLLIVIGFLFWQLSLIKSNVDVIVLEKDKAINDTEELKIELEELMEDHEYIKLEYGQLSDQLTEKDSLINEQAKEVKKLINSQADYRRIKRQLDYLRSITQGYVSQIDSLYQINQELTEENIEIKKTLKTEREIVTGLKEDKEGLVEQISSASYLKAYNVKANPYSLRGDKEIDTDRARRVDVVIVCFTLSENPLVDAGTKDIYLRIARPDNLILSQGSYSFIYQGERIQFSEKVSVKYDNKSQNVCITYKKGEKELMPGTYHVNLFADDNEIGQVSFVLR